MGQNYFKNFQTYIKWEENDLFLFHNINFHAAAAGKSHLFSVFFRLDFMVQVAFVSFSVPHLMTGVR